MFLLGSLQSDLSGELSEQGLSKAASQTRGAEARAKPERAEPEEERKGKGSQQVEHGKWLKIRDLFKIYIRIRKTLKGFDSTRRELKKEGKKKSYRNDISYRESDICLLSFVMKTKQDFQFPFCELSLFPGNRCISRDFSLFALLLLVFLFCTGL